MTRTQKLALRQSELRQKIGDMLDTPAETRAETFDDDLSKMTREARSIEGEIQAAIVSEPEPETRSDTPEGRELRSLVGRASLGTIIDGIIEHRSMSGAEDELQKLYRLPGNVIPLDLFRLERRAVTPAPGNVAQNEQPVVSYVFPGSCAAFLGVDMPTVGYGETVFPVLTSKLSVEALAENAGGTETDGTFSADVLTPSRIQASFFYSREDRMRFYQMESALRENLAMGLADGLDKAVVAGANGLLGASGLTARTGDAGAVASFATYRSLLYDADTVEGRYAMTASDVRLVFGPAGYNHAASVYRGNNADDSGIDVLMRNSGGVKVSSHVPAPATTGGASNDQAVIVRKGMARDMVAPIWQGVEIIHDEITKAANGQIVLTAVLLHAVKILREDGFERRVVQVA